MVIAEDHTLVREGTRQILEQHDDLRVIGEAGSGDEVVEAVERLRPDVALLDVRLPGRNGIDAAAAIAAVAPRTRILVLSAYDEVDYVVASLQAGAAGYLLKTTPGRDLVAAVRAVHRGETVLQPSVSRALARSWRRDGVIADRARLSPRELDVLRMLVQGRANKEIASALGLSLRTVEGHLGNIFAKLAVGSRTEAVLYAIHNRLLAVDHAEEVHA